MNSKEVWVFDVKECWVVSESIRVVYLNIFVDVRFIGKKNLFVLHACLNHTICFFKPTPFQLLPLPPILSLSNLRGHQYHLDWTRTTRANVPLQRRPLSPLRILAPWICWWVCRSTVLSNILGSDCEGFEVEYSCTTRGGFARSAGLGEKFSDFHGRRCSESSQWDARQRIPRGKTQNG